MLQINPYLEIFHDPIGDEDFFSFLRTQQSLTMTCQTCNNSWITERQNNVLTTLEYVEDITLCDQVTQYFQDGHYIKRCCHYCHKHTFGTKCNKYDSEEKMIPIQDQLLVHIQPEVVGNPTFLMIELHRFDETRIRDIHGKITAVVIEKVPDSNKMRIGQAAEVNGIEYKPIL